MRLLPQQHGRRRTGVLGQRTDRHACARIRAQGGSRRGHLALLIIVGLLGPGAAQAEPIQLLLPRPPIKIIPPDTPVKLKALRVCADPNNLPFSNRGGEGFENRIAELLADDLGVPVEYTWRAQRRGFVRNTIRAGKCDVIMGIVTGYELVSSTRPYYRSTYVFLTRQSHSPVASLDDPMLRKASVGVHLIGDDGANTPGAHALARRGIVDNVAGYSIYGDYGRRNPPARLVEAVAQRDVDVAILWGPLAGYFAPKQEVPLRLQPVSPPFDPPNQAFVYSVSMGVKRGNYALRRLLNDLIREHRSEIDRILEAYHVPRPD